MPFSQAKILVVGDVMLDRYWMGATHRISSEAPVPVFNFAKEQIALGGAGHVAHSIAAMGARATLVGIIGQDKAGEQIADSCAEQNIHSVLLQTKTPTIEKLRILNQHQHLLRTDFEEPWPASHQQALLNHYQENLAQADVVILSDYAKGTLHHMEQFIQLARAQNKIVIVDTKVMSPATQRYRGADIVVLSTADVGSQPLTNAELSEHMQQSLCALGVDAIVLTAGTQGMTLYQREVVPYHVPAIMQEVYDVTGVGDIVTAFIALGLAAGQDLPESIHTANVAASIAVSKLGTAIVAPVEFHLALHGGMELVTNNKIHMTLADATSIVQQAKQQGQKVVMTNGCFDVLHIGHAGYLKSAKQLGDKLIVAINTDSSIKRQGKPGERPFFSLADRLQAIAGIAAVDWVLPFDDDTPDEVIKALQPDILVKGPDYTVEQVQGSELVRAYGGEVMTIGPLAKGYSSTGIIEKIGQSSRTSEQVKGEW